MEQDMAEPLRAPQDPLVPGACRTGLLFLRGHRARVARLPVGEPEGLMPNLLSTEEYTGAVKEVH